MPLFSTIAHPTTPAVRGFSPKIKRTIASGILAGVVVGAGAGVAVTHDWGASDVSTSAGTTLALSHEEFLRLNTVDLGYVAPAVSAATSVPVARDQFLHWNTTAYAGLTVRDGQPGGIDTERFIEINTASWEPAPAQYAEPASGPR